jgi:hypothetical protein
MDLDPDRAARYRQLASEARRAAALSTHIQHREAYLNIAKGWTSLAEQVERELFETGEADAPRPGARVSV